MGSPAVRFERVTLEYGTRRIWSDLSLDVARGAFVAILGPNGSGKTSLLRAILGLVIPSSGRVLVQGRSPHRGDPDIGYVPQHSSLDRKSTRLNSSHDQISYAVFCLKKKKTNTQHHI